MKKINPSRVLRLIWQKKGITRVEIAQQLRLHKSTITIIINDLIRKGIVEETAMGQASPQGGRKPIFLMINKKYGCAAGLEVQPSYWKLIIINLEGEILSEHVARQKIGADNLLDVLAQSFRFLQGRVKKLKTELLGIGIGTSGIMNPYKGEIIQSIPLEIQETLPVAAPLQALVDVPVYIDNDANCGAWGELTFHKSLHVRNFLFVLIEIREEELVRKNAGGLAVGLGIVINGKVHYGATFSAGEFRSVFAKKTDVSQFSFSNKEILHINSDRSIFLRFVDELADNLALLVNILNVSHVFLSSYNVKFKDEIIPILKNKIKEKSPYALQSECQIGFSSFADRAVAYGAAGLILENIFAHPEIPKNAVEYEPLAATAAR